jgi:MFS transporter, FHS family, L-fucose permease
MPTKTPLLKTSSGHKYLIPYILVTSLFFLWGFAHGLLDVLNKHFQELLTISKAESGLVQFSVYGGYFLAALPAGYFMNRFGYKKGIIFGLLLYAFGAALFYPAAAIQSFWPFLTALLVIAFGLAFLETAANPYISVLGPSESAGRRLNLSQSFNGLGWIFGPLVGGLIIFGMQSTDGNKFSTISWPYMGVAVVVLLVAILFIRTPLPEIVEEREEGRKEVREGVREEGLNEERNDFRHEVRNDVPHALWSHPHFVLAVVAQFFYVAAQTGINSFFINYVTEAIKVSNTDAALVLSFGGMGLFWAGRLSGSFIMRSFATNKLLMTYAGICILLMLLVVGGLGWVSVSALFITYFFMSIMFPTIFVLGLKGLGPLTKKASSFIVMSIVGGALCPMLMGYIADHSSMRLGFVVPLVCFVVVFYYGVRGYRKKRSF